VLLVEQSVYKVDLDNLPEAEDQTNSKTKANGKWKGRGKVRKLKKQKGKGGKAYGDARGAKRGARGGQHDTIFIKEQPQINPEALDEGLYVLVQTGKCRRLVLTEIYGNKSPREQSVIGMK
jgi:hypothetical protein